MTKREMTIEEAIKLFKEVREELIAKETELSKQVFENLGLKAVELAIKVLEQTRWIPCSEMLPKADEYIGDVAKYYLVQNEYGDILVARYTHGEYWEQIYQLKPIADKIIAWMPLPQPYKIDSEWGSIGNNTDLETVPTNLQDWLSTFNTESATECFTAVQRLKERMNE